VSFSDANLTTRVRAVRNICLVAVLLALPFTADAQQRIVAGRGAAASRQSDPSQDNRRSDQGRSDQRRSDDRQSDRRQGDRRQGDRRQNDQRQNDQRQVEQRPTTGLGPLGLPPVPSQQLPWWEQRSTPWWEQRRIPSWEQKQPPPWERQQAPVGHTRIDRRIQERIHGNTQGRRHSQPPIIYVLPPYRYFPTNTVYGYGVSSTTVSVAPPPPNVVTAAPPEPEPMVETGFLRLEVEPRDTLQVFVDGLYLGTPADLGDEIELRLGARRIELRAPGYRTLIFDTQIVPDRTIVYRGALELTPSSTPRPPEAPRVQSPATPAPNTAAPRAPAKMFLIPGCYLGNVEPDVASLRPGCDLKKLIVSP
jgi:hypothetical protein